MTPQEVYNLLRQRLGARATSNQLAAHLIAELNAAQLSLESTPPYPFFLELFASGLLPSTTFNGFELPADFITEHEDRPLTYTATSGVKTDLEKRPFSELVHGKYNTEGSPLYYAIVGGRMYILFRIRAMVLTRYIIMGTWRQSLRNQLT